MKYHIWTEGCQMNTADSQRLASALESLGYEAAEKQAIEAEEERKRQEELKKQEEIRKLSLNYLMNH